MQTSITVSTRGGQLGVEKRAGSPVKRGRTVEGGDVDVAVGQAGQVL